MKLAIEQGQTSGVLLCYCVTRVGDRWVGGGGGAGDDNNRVV